MVKTLSIQEKPFPWGNVQSQALIILKNCFLIPVALHSLSSMNYRRWKATLLVYHHYFCSLIPFLLNLTRKKNNQDRFLPPIFSIFLMGKPNLSACRGMRIPPPSMLRQGWHRSGTYWPDAEGWRGSVLLLHLGLHRLQNAGTGCWCNMDHQRDLLCRQVSMRLPLLLSSVISHRNYLQLVYSMHRFLVFFFNSALSNCKSWKRNDVLLYSLLK